MIRQKNYFKFSIQLTIYEKLGIDIFFMTNQICKLIYFKHPKSILDYFFDTSKLKVYEVLFLVLMIVLIIV